MKSSFQILQFFTSSQTKDSKVISECIKGEITCMTSGSSFLFAADSESNIYKFDHHFQVQTIATDLESISYLHVLPCLQKVLAAGVSKNKSSTYSIVSVDFSNFSDISDGISRFSISSIDVNSKTDSLERARFFTSSSSSKEIYIAFVTAPNEIQILKYTSESFNNLGKSKNSVLKYPGGEITNMLITDSGKLFITTENSTMAYDCNTLKKLFEVESGCHPKFAFLDNDDQLVVCLDKTVSTYTANGPGTTLNLSDYDGIPESIGCLGPYLYAIYPITLQGPSQKIRINVIDPVYKIIVYQCTLNKPISFIHMLWGAIVIISQDKSVSTQSEISEQEKVDLFCSKQKYNDALDIAMKKNLGEATIANVHKLYGDYLYDQSKYDEAIGEYIKTLGYTEPSHVIKKFVEPIHARNLMNYLNALQDMKLATKQHTTLLFNCYTKVKAKEELKKEVDKFIEAANKNEEPSFDVETAVDVLKRNNFQEYAESLAKAYHMHRLYIQLLYEKQKYKEMLEYIECLSGSLVKSLLSDYGSEIMDNYAEGSSELTDFCVKICTDGILGGPSGQRITKIQPDDLAMIFINNDQKHFDFLYQIFKKDPKNLTQKIWDVLIEMALRAKSTEVMTLLKYPGANYSDEQALVFLTAFNHTEGKKYIYEKMGLYTLILQDAAPEDCLNICIDHGDKDRTLWSDALVKLSHSKCDSEILSQFLQKVQEKDALPFLTILKVLKSTQNHSFKTILPIVQSTFKKEQDLLREAQRKIKECNENASKNREVIQDLSTKNYAINQKLCDRCGKGIESEAYHFMCGHSFHIGCLDNTSMDVCPICKHKYEEILEEKLARMEAARNQTSVQDRLNEAGDGFQFLLQQVGHSLFASGVDLMSSKQDDEKITEVTELLKKIRGEKI